MLRRGRARDLTKERYWRDVLRRQRRSGQTVRAFCEEHDLSQASFHAWQRTIAQRDLQSVNTPVDAGRAQLPAFVPLRVTATPVAATSSTTSALEVVVGPGRLIRVSPGFDPAALRSLLAVLEEAPSC